MARDPLNEDGKWNGVDGIVNWKGLRIWWNKSFTYGIAVCAKEYGDWRMVGVGGCPE